MVPVVLCLWMPVVIGFGVYSPGCLWEVALHELGPHYNETVSYIADFQGKSPSVNELLEKWDWSVDQKKTENEEAGLDYVPHSYYIILTLHDPEQVRRTIQFGLRPEIELLYRPNTHVNGAVSFTLPASLVDWQAINGYGVECEEEYCELSWASPLPISREFLIDGKVISHGIGHMFPDQRFIIGTSYYHLLTDNGTKDFDLAASLDALDQITLHYIDGMSSTKLIPLVDGHLHVLLVSQDDFHTWTVLQIPDDFFHDNTANCSCLKHPFDAAAMSNSILFQVKSGIYQLTEASISGRGNTLEKQLDACTRGLRPPSHTYSYHHFAIANGACENEGIIYFAHIDNTPGIAYSFNIVRDSKRRHVCESLTDVSKCSIVTTAASERNRGSALILLDVVMNDGTQQYMLVEMIFDDAEWIVLNSIPKMIPFSQQNHPSQLYLLPDKIPILNTSIHVQLEVTLHGIALTPWISQYIVLWGNRILKSPDFAQHFYMYPEEMNITQLHMTNIGDILFLTDKGQLHHGAVSTSAFQQLYPSPSWNILHSLHTSLPDANFKILSIFQNRFGETDILFVQDGNLKSVSLPVAAILNLIEVKNALKTSISLILSDDDYILSLEYCPYAEIKLGLSQPNTMTKVESFNIAEPMLSTSTRVHSNTSLLVLNALIHNFNVWASIYNTQSYSSDFPCPLDEWGNRHKSNSEYDQYLFQNKMLYEGIRFNFDDFKCISMPQGVRRLPKVMYLNRNDVMSFEVVMRVNDEYGIKKKHKADLNTMDLSTILSDNTLVSLTTIRTDYIAESVSKFEIIIKDRGYGGTQSQSGYHLYPVSLALSAWHAPLHCFDRISSEDTMEIGLYTSDIMIGCPPHLRIKFDWQAAYYRSDHQEVREEPLDCFYPDPKLPCFYFSNGFYPVFKIRDEGVNKFVTYNGNYTLKIIGGSADSKDDIKMFTSDEIYHYNNQKSKSTAKIWGPMDDTELYEGWPVFTINNSAVSWFCQPHSPCANIMPNLPENPEYYFLVEFSNVPIDSSSYCDFTFVFVVHVYGLPIDLFYVALPLIMTTFALLFISAMLYFLCNNKQNACTRKIYYGFWRKIFRKHKVDDEMTPEKELAIWRQTMLQQHLRQYESKNEDDKCEQTTSDDDMEDDYNGDHDHVSSKTPFGGLKPGEFRLHVP